MIGNKVEQSDLVGDIKDFPIEVVQGMVNEQVRQGNEADASVFARRYYFGRANEGFDWDKSPDGHTFWSNVISNFRWEEFFTKYPKTNNKMEEEKSIKIQIPDGYEIDEAKSSFTEIKFKPIEVKYPDSWEDAFLNKPIIGHYFSSISELKGATLSRTDKRDKNLFKAEKQAESALAYAQLTQLMALPIYNGDWEADWKDCTKFKYSISREGDRLVKGVRFNYYEEIVFKSPEIRDIFFDKYQDLLQTYYQNK